MTHDCWVTTNWTRRLYTRVATNTLREVVSPFDHLIKIFKAPTPPN